VPIKRIQRLRALEHLRLFAKLRIDPDFRNSMNRSRQPGLAPIAESDIRRAMSAIEASEGSVELDPDVFPTDLWEQSQAFAQIRGYWPLSFAYPQRSIHLPNKDYARKCARIIPGQPYTYTDADSYYGEYGSSLLAITHRKYGWDCFRHVEILSQGCVPLMLDVDDVPTETMFHYPKEALSQVSANLFSEGLLPGLETRRRFTNHFNSYLTTAALGEYILAAGGWNQDARILFVDRSGSFQADYQSVLALIGLKQILGPRCEVPFPIDYIYRDSRIALKSLYGRGFGYARTVDAGLRSSPENSFFSSSLRNLLRREQFDGIVVGSISRNWPLAREIRDTMGQTPISFLYGEDWPPLSAEWLEMQQSRATLMLRHGPPIEL
jgi:hypothetical protein